MNKNDIIMKCCVCKRIKTDRGWNYQFMPVESRDHISHGYCPTCFRQAMMQVEASPLTGVLEIAR